MDAPARPAGQPGTVPPRRRLAVSAILLADLALVAWFLGTGDGPSGGLALPFLVSMGLIGWVESAGSGRRYAAGFTAGAGLAALIGLQFLLLPGGRVQHVFDRYVNFALWMIPTGAADASFGEAGMPEGELAFRPTVWLLLYTEMVVALPSLLLAALGAAVALHWPSPERTEPDPP